MAAARFPAVQSYSGLGLGEVISENQGQARLVCLLTSHPGWIYKEYKTALRPAAEAELDLLITLPARLAPADRLVIDASTSWPSARVVKDDRTCGVVLPLAPPAFTAEIRVMRGVKRGPLTIDWLAEPAATQRNRGVDPPSTAQRVAACASLATTAAVLERQGVVYLDWSFGNAFWSYREHTTYLIDMDGCSFGNRPMIESPGWEDHLHPMGTLGGLPVDRFRLALLVARCLIEDRTASAEAAAAALATLAGRHRQLVPVQEVVARALRGARPEDRPSLADLAAALTAAATAFASPTLVTASVGAPTWRPYVRPGTANPGTPTPSATTATGPNPPTTASRPYTPKVPVQRRPPVPVAPAATVPVPPRPLVPVPPVLRVPDTARQPVPPVGPPRPFTPPVPQESGSGSGGGAALAAGVVMAFVAVLIILFIIGALSGH